MQQTTPQFTNPDLLRIKQRSNDAGLLIDLVQVNSTFSDDNKTALRISGSKENCSIRASTLLQNCQ